MMFRNVDKMLAEIREKYWNRDGAKVGEKVIKFQCDGCMASDHKFQWIGEITGFEPGSRNVADCHFAVVKIIKRDHLDWRDKDLGEERIVVEDGSFQRLSANLFGYFK